MDQQKNNISLWFGVPGVVIQLGSFCVSGFMTAGNAPPDIASLITLAGLLIGTALLMVGLAYYAMAKGHSAAWCLIAFLGIIGLIVLATLPDRHGHADRVRSINARISDTPTENSPAFQCPACDYQLNGIPGNACPECGQLFDPNDLTTVKVQGFYREKIAPWTGRWSLICGILGIVLVITMFCGPVVGIIGVAFGHSARKTIRDEELPGAGVALAGLITSYVAIGLSLLFIFLAFILPALAESMGPA